jgi:hypothetical protein
LIDGMQRRLNMLGKPINKILELRGVRVWIGRRANGPDTAYHGHCVSRDVLPKRHQVLKGH